MALKITTWIKDINTHGLKLTSISEPIKIITLMIGTVHGRKIKRNENYKLLEKCFNCG